MYVVQCGPACISKSTFNVDTHFQTEMCTLIYNIYLIECMVQAKGGLHAGAWAVLKREWGLKLLVQLSECKILGHTYHLAATPIKLVHIYVAIQVCMCVLRYWPHLHLQIDQANYYLW